MKQMGLREVTDFLPAEQRGELVSAWLQADLDYLVLCQDREGTRTGIRRVGPGGEVGTLAKALRSPAAGRPYAYLETLAFVERGLAEQARQLAERDANRPPGGAEAPPQSDVDEITAELLNLDMAQREMADRLLEWERRLRAREREVSRENEQLLERSEYVSHVENSLMEKLEEANRRAEELDQLREDIERREAQLTRKSGQPNLRLISGEQ